MAKRKRRAVGYPEPGQWVWERTQGLPSIHPPEPLKDGLISAEELLEHIAYEGLGHCLFCFSSEKLKGLRLRKLWKTAQEASKDIVVFLEDVDLGISQNKPVKPVKTEAFEFGEDVTDDVEI